MPLVFVYGTFMRGRANNGVLTGLGATFVASARTFEPRTLVDFGPYPALVDADAPDAPVATGPVFGELWEVPQGSLAPLDAFEGCPEIYKRVSIAIEKDGGARQDVFVYVFARCLPRRARVITSGRYEATGDVLPEGATLADLGADEGS